jgi:two-component system C4-dicarboxylate transport response regulator DctD
LPTLLPRFPAIHSSASVQPVRKKAPAPAVVIVDDEKSYVELMAQMLLNNLDCAVHPFTRPAEALKALPSIAPGVVVSDYFMPDMDGVEFIRQATKLLPNTAFIIISGHDLDAVGHELVRLKRLRLRLQKPFGWKPLADAVIEVWPGAGVPGFRS